MRNIPLCLCALLICSPVFSQTTAPKPRVAVLNFKNMSGKTSYDFLSSTIAESITTRLKKTDRLQVLERSRLSDILEEQNLSLSGIAETPESAKQVGGILQADILILGSFSVIGDRIEVNARAVSVNSGEVDYSAKASETMGEALFDKINELAATLELELSAAESGYITVDSTPRKARVLIDGEPVGMTPLVKCKVEAGEHRVTLQHEGFELVEKTVSIRNGETFRLDITMKQKADAYRPYRVSFGSRFLQTDWSNYVPDFALSFDWRPGWVSLGAEFAEHVLFHQSSDTNAPGQALEDSMQLFIHRLSVNARLNLFYDNPFISPYLGVAGGIAYAFSSEYEIQQWLPFWKAYLGVDFVPNSVYSFFIEAVYQDMGDLTIREKVFNYFGNATLTEKTVSLRGFNFGAGLRFAF